MDNDTKKPDTGVPLKRLVMPVCPYCDTEMKPFDFRGYYDSFTGWECQCASIPNADIQRGNYA